MDQNVPQIPFEQQINHLKEENQELRARLESIERRDEAIKKAQKRLLKGGWRIMLPLLDRQRVVRSFSKLIQKLSDYSNPRSEWPTKDEVLVDARDFLESCARFAIRRRTVVLIFSILAVSVPFIQVYLVVQQNEIIQNQTDMSRIQLYDIVSRTLAEGDRNSRQMTGALLANAELDFLGGVIRESFGLAQSQYRDMGEGSAKRRFEDAAFRGHLIRAVVRGTQLRKGVESDREIYSKTSPMFKQILTDGTDRMQFILGLGKQTGVADEETVEQVDNYFAQVGSALQVYSRLSRSAGREQEFYNDVRPFFNGLSRQPLDHENRFFPVYQAVMQDFLIDLALAPQFGGSVDLESQNLTPTKALDKGFNTLRNGLGQKAINWPGFKRQVEIR